jgi:hypothetical protein
MLFKVRWRLMWKVLKEIMFTTTTIAIVAIIGLVIVIGYILDDKGGD